VYRLRKDEDVHADVVDGSLLRVRRLTRGELRWEHTTDLAGVYADRFTAPSADVIDGWFGGTGELRLIVHVHEPTRLLPPRELTYATDGPRLERSRPGADRHTLASAPLREYAWSGEKLAIVQELPEHVLATTTSDDARRLGWSVADAPDIGYRWFERSEIGNLPPPERSDPCKRCSGLGAWGPEYVSGMNPIAVDRERGQARRSVQCSTCRAGWQIDEVLEQGTMKQLWKWSRIGQRVVAAKPSVDLAAAAGVFAKVDAAYTSVRVKGCAAKTLVKAETLDRFELEAAAPEPDLDLEEAGFTCKRAFDEREQTHYYAHELVVAKTDPRLEGFELVEYRGHQVRVADRSAYGALLVAHHSLRDPLGFELRHLLCYGWVPQEQLRPVRPGA
jgi:hypothetical protein